ncbi:uncharacterized protein LOC111051467 [Nilaparvata lugens]|uniref:uncharacterized protein LOC111051467 n=1 Tax=Nilaparvata lugens TaxID=108931 RepID=UPI00193E793E|nr:uncharacterized protein LOC111051467 [Nilaparvata lugens]XP_039285434.1 uncharacterized protein LOC111051467 [Nilaparvata lugens]
MFLLETFFQRITTDFRQKELLPLKLLFFVHASTLYVLYPYLTIHMRELGINVEEAAIMSAVTPIVAIIMPPVAGVIADRIGNFRFLLSLFSTLGGAMSLLLLLVPVGRVTINYPEQVLLDLHCSIQTQGALELTIGDENPCLLPPNLLSAQEKVALDLKTCGLLCYRDPDEFSFGGDRGPSSLDNESLAILRARSYTIAFEDADANTTDDYTYLLSADDLMPIHDVDDDLRRYRHMENFGRYHSSVRKFNNNTYFFPAGGLYDFVCADAKCSIARTNRSVPPVFKPVTQHLSVDLRRVADAEDSDPRFNVDHVRLLSQISNVSDSNKYLGSICHGEDTSYEFAKVSIPLLNPENSLEVDTTLTLTSCQPACLITAKRKTMCTNHKRVVEYDIKLTFWLYLIIRVFISMISGTAFAMFEGAVIAILREHKADYGLQRIYAAIGGMISSPLSGMLIDYASQNKGYTDFKPAFYLYAGLKIISGALMMSMNLEFKSPAANVVADVLTVLKNIEIVALFITCFILGTAWGYIESFLFWLLQDLGASRSLMGITITIGGIAGLPLLVMSGPIIDKIGHADVLFIGFVFYAIRLLGYSLIYNPWMCLIFEAMESVTSSLAFTAAVTYAAKLSTTTTDSSIQGLLGGLYFGVGKGAGSLIGGYLMQAVGTRPTYQIFSATTLITGCIYYLFNHFYIKQRAVQKENFNAPITNLDKEKEAKESYGSSFGNDVKHVIENTPLNNPSNNSKKYTSDKAANDNQKVNKGLEMNSCHLNLGYTNEDEETRLRNRGQVVEDKR